MITISIILFESIAGACVFCIISSVNIDVVLYTVVIVDCIFVVAR